jgi:hypothetical protein
MTLNALQRDPDKIFLTENQVLDDIATLINAVYQMAIEPTKDGRVPKRILNKLYPQIKGTPRIDYNDYNWYIDMLFDLLLSLRIVQRTLPPTNDIKSRYEPGPWLPAWTRLDSTAQMRKILDYWMQHTDWQDVPVTNENIDSLEGLDSPWEYNDWIYYLNVPRAREMMLEQLKQCSPGQWIDLSALLHQIWENDPLGAWKTLPSYLYKKELNKIRGSFEAWAEKISYLYLRMIGSSLREFGVIDFGANINEAQHSLSLFFRLTEQGVAALNQTGRSSETGDSQKMLIVQPTFELLLLQRDTPILYSLLPFAQLNQVGMVSRLTLTKASLHHGMSEGMSLEQIVQVLSKHSSNELPQNVVYTLNDWAKQYKESRLSMALLIEVPNQEIAQHLCTVEKFVDWGIRQLSPTILSLNGSAPLQQVRTALEREGITIHLTGSFPARARSVRDY